MTNQHTVDGVAEPVIARRSTSDVVSEALRATPNLVKLIWRCMRDRRVPTRAKVTAGVAAGYFVLPVDLIPDFIPVVGQLDDLLVLFLGIHQLVKATPPDVIEELWDGDDDALELVTGFLAWMAELVPGPLQRAIGIGTGTAESPALPSP
ncbi:hypothetical protein BMS3Bbin02_01697 [bacterium BMS3Bbin02]|nr:hypothetical protein BMS3Bbin02_01697 [bacterium BMS3Bbin02]